MKRLRLLPWSGTTLSPRSSSYRTPSPSLYHKRWQSPAPAASRADFGEYESATKSATGLLAEEHILKLPSPPVQAASSSAKLAALHARLRLPSRLPIQTLARVLVDFSADPSPRFNNKSFAILGHDLLSYYTSEFVICQYPRLPLAVVYSAVYGYVGSKALAAISREWGVESAAHPGGEVDPGLLQFKRVAPEPDIPPIPTRSESLVSSGRHKQNKSASSPEIEYSEHYEEQEARQPSNHKPDLEAEAEAEGVTEEKASAKFVMALMGALYLHAGRASAKSFFKEHFMSRQLNVANLFSFRNPKRDLHRLCAREGFLSPVARMISETGRKSRHPVFVIGIFSGEEKLGEGAGSSIDEARICAAIAALKGWYLYSPPDFRVPSQTHERDAPKWDPVLVDPGDIVS